MNNKFYIIIILFLIFCIPTKKVNQNKIHHLIIDAGSSGTRFCLYTLKKNSYCELENFQNSCFDIPSMNGLADLSKNEIYNTLNEGFKVLEKNKKLSEIHFISLLGTGGFRKLSDKERNIKETILNEYFKKNVFIPYKVKVLTGKEEAYFAWKSIFLLYQSTQHITLETGGATIQIAIGDFNHFDFISLPIGMNQSYENLLKYKDFEKCIYGKILSYEDYEDCKYITIKYIYKNKQLEDFLKKYNNKINNYKIYTLGKAWNAIFNYIDKNPITIKDINEKGKYFCNLDEQNLIKKGIPSKFAKQFCYLFYYHNAQLEFLKIDTIYKGTESWTLGASNDEDTIPYCKN